MIIKPVTSPVPFPRVSICDSDFGFPFAYHEPPTPIGILFLK